jgi:multidrug efflux pump subunit AcrB
MVKDKNASLSIWQRVGLFFYDRRVLTITILLVLIGFGALSYTRLMRREGFPAVNVPVGIVQVINFDQSAVEVDGSFAKPIIDAAKADKNTKEVVSTSTDQGATISISYKDDTDVQIALDEIKKKVQDKLPASGQVVYIKVNAGKLTPEGDDLLISVHGSGLNATELDAAAERLVPIIKQKVPLAQDARVYPLVESVLNPTTGESQSAQVRFDRYLDSDTETALPSVAVGVAGVEGVDQLKLYDQVQAALKSEEAADVGADSEIAADYAENIRSQVSGLQLNLFEGLIAVLIVSFILISLRGSLVTAFSMAATVTITVGILNLIGFTINTITLFSLVLCLALIVDDTTIIVEAIDAGLDKGKKFRDVVSTSLRKVIRASATGTFTTILAFAPMLFIGGILGEFIRAIPITIIISLLVSLVVSIVFIPLLMRLSFGRKLATYSPRRGNMHRLEAGLGNYLSNMLLKSTKTKVRSLSTKLHAVFFATLVVIAAGFVFRTVEFNIFPAPKDGIEILVSAKVSNQETATIETTESLSDGVLSSVKEIVSGDLQKATLLAGPTPADRSGFSVRVILSDLKKRDTTSVEIAQKLQTALDSRFPELKITAASAGVGPPDGAFTVQVRSDNTEAAQVLAKDLREFLQQTTLERVDGTTATLKDVTLTPSVVVARQDGNRVLNVSAGFSAKDVSALVDLAQKAVEKEFTPERVASYGVSSDALQFDFGQEEENQESFASMGRAAGPLFLAMFLLMAVLFKSLLQPLLILTALPFAIFGVATGLSLTDNPISFFTMMGVFALIGISINNTVLLTDYANQARAEGLPSHEAMASALKARLRPLLTTSLTSVLALLPLALNDPFWEGLAFTLVFGLLSSTILVLLIFPYFYLIEEAMRFRVRRIFKRV